MKNRILQPGFEAIFSISIIAILCMPQMLLAQTHKEVNIVIRNSDTLYNGKNIKELKGEDRREALAEINKVTKPATEVHTFSRIITKPGKGDSSRVQVYSFNGDTLRANARVDIDKILRDGIYQTPQMSFRVDKNREPAFADGFNFNTRLVSPADIKRRNTQNFIYTNTDDNGISTHVNYRVTEPATETLKRIAAIEKTTLTLNDLTLTPQFSAGTTTLAFSLPVKAAADVQLTDSNGKPIWKAAANSETFSKTFVWPMNGLYYLVVKQAGKTAIKQIVKD